MDSWLLAGASVTPKQGPQMQGRMVAPKAARSDAMPVRIKASITGRDAGFRWRERPVPAFRHALSDLPAAEAEAPGSAAAGTFRISAAAAMFSNRPPAHPLISA